MGAQTEMSMFRCADNPRPCYGVAAGIAILFGGGGGVIRQSINFHTASTSNAVMIAATNCRVSVKLF